MLRVQVRDPAGAPVEHGSVRVRGVAAGRTFAPLVDPGECDDIGPERCFHPGGWYETVPMGGDPPTVWTVEISSPTGEDRVRISL